MRDWNVEQRAKLQPQFDNLQLKAVGIGSQPFILWKNRQYATHRLTFDRDVLQVEGQPLPKRKNLNDEDQDDDDDDDGDEKEKAEEVAAPDPDLTIPADPDERSTV